MIEKKENYETCTRFAAEVVIQFISTLLPAESVVELWSVVLTSKSVDDIYIVSDHSIETPLVFLNGIISLSIFYKINFGIFFLNFDFRHCLE